ncbi:hypothetical protein AGR1B_pTi0169 [Agrobacterium fabacearum S56]|nr:RolB family protein [Agrobacterium tumefaciens]CUX06532.1 hypothetical protein AGR1B_pTi0169 [Agrobacterium fabacearum S56]
MMVYQRPVFTVISLLRIRNREEAKLVLIGAVVVYRNFVEQTLADAQKIGSSHSYSTTIRVML